MSAPHYALSSLLRGDSVVVAKCFRQSLEIIVDLKIAYVRLSPESYVRSISENLRHEMVFPFSQMVNLQNMKLLQIWEFMHWINYQASSNEYRIKVQVFASFTPLTTAVVRGDISTPPDDSTRSHKTLPASRNPIPPPSVERQRGMRSVEAPSESPINK